MLFLIITSTVGCSEKSKSQKLFGVDADYFVGLQKLAEGKEKEARTKLNRCIRKGSFYCAKKSAQLLCTFGNVQEKNEAAINLISKYKDDESLLIAAKQFESSDEISKLIECTSNIDFKTAKNELIYLRLNAMKKRGDSNYQNEVYDWFTSCPISKEHYQFYKDIYEHPDFAKIQIDEKQSESDSEKPSYTPRQFVLNFRIEVFKRNYIYAYNNTKKILQYFDDGNLPANTQLCSDIGKAYLYGSTDFAKNASYFSKLAEQYKRTDKEFYFWFYAGRLFSKASDSYSKVAKCFEAAIQSAQSTEQKDNAIWYLLKSAQDFSLNTLLDSIQTHSKQWNDPEYFEDLFESLVPTLLSSGQGNSFGSIYKIIDGYASDETVARFAYLYARLSQEGYADAKEQEIKEAFSRACRSGSAIYYRQLAAYQLGLKDTELYNVLSAPVKNSSVQFSKQLKEPLAQSDTKAKDFEKLIKGYAYFGFPEKIYETFVSNKNEQLPLDSYFYLADFLSKCSNKSEYTEKFYTQALRISAEGQRKASENMSKAQMRLLFPENYKEYVEKYCQQFNVNDKIMYALIRSESFFDPSVKSSAGAIGLTQLMEVTGSDISKRFKMQNYSLTDPETNIKFGTYYLSTLVSRCDNSYLLGFLSYNAGITRVRKWQKSSLVEFGKRSEMPLDLFLETVPFAETREYGRKLISATVMYDWLDNPENFESTVSALLK